MKLERYQRFVIVNQFKILETLYPDDADSLARDRKIFEEGFEYHYSEAMQDISMDVMSKDDCIEVMHTLHMFLALQDAFKKYGQSNGLDESAVQFTGYDGNSESKYGTYAEYMTKDRKQYSRLFNDTPENFDYHGGVNPIEKYKRMLQVWSKLPERDRNDLTENDFLAIVNAQNHPT